MDPASASLDVARARPGAQRVTWRLGEATMHSTLRFRDRDEITASLTSSGFTIDEIRDAPDRPRREFVFIARPTHE
ncbi:MAG TPA: hypothetical protein VES40_13495 [Ilumatobacteraceae bacterium]|nr:hypothetical protein [Ilumatobacteraceae bacterium]